MATEDRNDKTFNALGHKTGKGHIKNIQKLLRNRNQDHSYKCDSPSESLGNCFPYSLMQQLYRTDIYCTLSEEMKILCENYHQLRLAIIEFVKNIDTSSQYFTPIDEGRYRIVLCI